MDIDTGDDAQDLSRYTVRSRREIISLLRNVEQKNQLVRMQANRGADSAVTSILEVDDASNSVIIDCAPSAMTNQRVLDSDDIAFETVLENIRILFFAPGAESCDHDGRPALRIALPESMIRLQRREFYRVPTPVTNPVRCTIPVREEGSKTPVAVTVSLYNVSAGGIAVVDEKKQISPDLGSLHENCRIDLPGGAVVVNMRLRNSQEVKLTNGKEIRRLGFMFVDPPNAVVAAMQRYITKLERERNARATGMG